MRTILATIGLVLATALLIYVVLQIRQVLTWIVVGAFFAVALYPLVGWVQRRLLGGRRRALATFLVFLSSSSCWLRSSPPSPCRWSTRAPSSPGSCPT